MQFKLYIVLVTAILLTTACNPGYLSYRTDFEDSQIEYYKTSLDNEAQIQKQSIEQIQASTQKLSELCYVLYHRFPTKRDKYSVLEANLKLARLNKAINTLQIMREKFNQGFKLILTREDWVSGPLRLQCELEVHYLSSFIDELNESRARIAYLARFRQEALLMNELPEEKLEGIDNDLYRVEKELADIIYKQIPAYLQDVGVVITRDDQFKFAYTNGVEPKKEADKEAEEVMMNAGKKELLGDVTEYEYEFEVEREKFDLAFQELKASIDRFQQTIEAFAEHAQKTKSINSMELQLAEQSRQITLIMEQSAGRIKSLFDESMADINTLVGTELKVIDNELWSKLKAETDEEAKKINQTNYHDNVVELSTDFQKMFDMGNEKSDAAQFRYGLLTFGKNLQDKKGIWGPGYSLLNPEWQQKVTIDRIDSQLNAKLNDLENYIVQAVRPLWKTASARMIKDGQEPDYKADAKGFLMPAEKK